MVIVNPEALTYIFSRCYSMKKTYRAETRDIAIHQDYKVGHTPNWIMYYEIKKDVIRLESHMIQEPDLIPIIIEIDEKQLDKLISLICEIHQNPYLKYELGTQVELIEDDSK